MRGARWLLLVAIAAILAGIGFTYRAQKNARRAQEPPRPASLPLNVASSSVQWTFDEKDTKDGRPCSKVQIQAADFKELKDTQRVDLKGVVLKAPNKECTTYNLIKSAEAAFFKTEKRLYSEGDVEVTLDVPMEGAPAHTLVTIRTSGVTVDTTTNRADTDRPVSFLFEHGDGTSIGASYDPGASALVLKKEAVINWKPEGKPAMKIEGSSLEYNEAAAQVRLRPWGKLTRGNTVIEGEDSVIHLSANAKGQKIIRKVDSSKAHGTDEYPARKLQYAADTLAFDFDENGVLRVINAQDNARLVSNSGISETEITAKHVEMAFDTASSESVLQVVKADGNAVVTSKPLAVAGAAVPETHVLRSEQLEMKMRPGGEEIETVLTHAPGTIEFLPNLPIQRRRVLEGQNLVIAYGPRNRVETFRATDVRTLTEPNAEEKKRKRGNSTTTSREIFAKFEPNSSRLATMEQQGDFTYEEGQRHARAHKATLDSAQNLIVLETAARVWDPTGSTAADKIRLNQVNGDFTAENNVVSSRMPDHDGKQNSQMLSGDAPIQAKANFMRATDDNSKILYRGAASMWQGANRIQGETIDIDRGKRTLVADGNVVTDLWEKPDPPAPGKVAPPPVQTVVRAPHLVYTEQNRLAFYSGGSVLTRTDLRVKAREIRAYLAESKPGAENSLEKAFADGSAEIVHTVKKETRTGTGEHAEYYTSEQKIILTGGSPRLVIRDAAGGLKQSEGENLTYFATDGRLLVNGSPERPGQTHIQKKH